MNKADAQAWQARMATFLAARSGPALADDGRLVHDEWDGRGRWAQRFAGPGRWPHAAGPGRAGLRYELWYPQGKVPAGKGAKPEEIGLYVLLARRPELAGLQAGLAPLFEEFVVGGKYARRYQPIAGLVTALYPDTLGVGRVAPAVPAKAEEALETFLRDTLDPIEKAVSAWSGAGGQTEYAEAAYDPIAELARKFGKT